MSDYIEENIGRLPTFADKKFRRYMDAPNSGVEMHRWSLHKSRDLVAIMVAAEAGARTVTFAEIADALDAELPSVHETRYEADAYTKSARSMLAIGNSETAKDFATEAITKAYDGDGHIIPAIKLLRAMGVKDPIGEALA